MDHPEGINIIIMKNFIAKKKIEHQGNSQFTRSKLESQYNPKYRTSKHQLMSFQKIPLRDRHQYIYKEEQEICQKAIGHIKKGSNLVIDWSTRTNFRTTNSLLPKLKTEPSEMRQDYQEYESANSGTPIQQKRLQLAKLLHVRHKKHYLQTKRQQQQQKNLFGNSHHINKQPPTQSLHQLSRRKNDDRFFFAKKKPCQEEDIEKIQSNILSGSKLELLKEQLKAKFVEIKDYIHRNGSKSKSKEKRKVFFE